MFGDPSSEHDQGVSDQQTHRSGDRYQLPGRHGAAVGLCQRAGESRGEREDDQRRHAGKGHHQSEELKGPAIGNLAAARRRLFSIAHRAQR